MDALRKDATGTARRSDRMAARLYPDGRSLTSASRASVQRNLAWMEARGLIREVTGQGRYRMCGWSRLNVLWE